MKAGGAYVPIDSNYPPERINSIIDDSRLKVLITRGKYQNASIKITAGLVDLDRAMVAINTPQVKPSKAKVSGRDIAYVIYTSGSTGKPKGVMIEHHSVINRILWMQKAYPITQEDVLLQKNTHRI